MRAVGSEKLGGVSEAWMIVLGTPWDVHVTVTYVYVARGPLPIGYSIMTSSVRTREAKRSKCWDSLACLPLLQSIFMQCLKYVYHFMGRTLGSRISDPSRTRTQKESTFVQIEHIEQATNECVIEEY